MQHPLYAWIGAIENMYELGIGMVGSVTLAPIFVSYGQELFYIILNVNPKQSKWYIGFRAGLKEAHTIIDKIIQYIHIYC